MVAGGPIIIPNLLHFTAFFENGTTIEQNEADISLVYPDKNCLYEVMERDKLTKLISFVLAGYGYFIGVDLRDGHFEVNQIPFHLYRQDLLRHNEFELYYARISQQMIQANVHNGEQTPIGGRVGGYELGWVVKIGEEEIKKTLTIYMSE